MPTPTSMKPICDMDEQASVRFRSTENSASSAPTNIVITPKISMALPQAASAGSILAAMTSSPNRPVLVSMPESSALAGAGATGCALGSQMCSGKTPALAAKPTAISAAMSRSSEGFTRPAAIRLRMPTNSSVPILL